MGTQSPQLMLGSTIQVFGPAKIHGKRLNISWMTAYWMGSVVCYDNK